MTFFFYDCKWYIGQLFHHIGHVFKTEEQEFFRVKNSRHQFGLQFSKARRRYLHALRRYIWVCLVKNMDRWYEDDFDEDIRGFLSEKHHFKIVYAENKFAIGMEDDEDYGLIGFKKVDQTVFYPIEIKCGRVGNEEEENPEEIEDVLGFEDNEKMEENEEDTEDEFFEKSDSDNEVKSDDVEKIEDAKENVEEGNDVICNTFQDYLGFKKEDLDIDEEVRRNGILGTENPGNMSFDALDCIQRYDEFFNKDEIAVAENDTEPAGNGNLNNEAMTQMKIHKRVINHSNQNVLSPGVFVPIAIDICDKIPDGKFFKRPARVRKIPRKYLD